MDCGCLAQEKSFGGWKMGMMLPFQIVAIVLMNMGIMNKLGLIWPFSLAVSPSPKTDPRFFQDAEYNTIRVNRIRHYGLYNGFMIPHNSSVPKNCQAIII